MLFDILSSLAVESICYACLMIDRRTQDAFQLCRFCVLTAIPAKMEAGGFEKVILAGEKAFRDWLAVKLRSRQA